LIIRNGEAKPLVAAYLNERSTIAERLRLPRIPDDLITFTCALEDWREPVYFLKNNSSMYHRPHTGRSEDSV
jgi:hypothetical protein